jgi:hypothetical protein
VYFCNAEQQLLNFGGQHSIHQMSSPHRHSRTFSPLWVITRLGPLVSPTSIVDDWLIWIIALATFEQKKFIQSCRCESFFDPGGRFALRLANPNTSSPSKCNILAERPKFEVYLVATTIIWTRSLDWVALCRCNGFLFELDLGAPHC